MSSPHGRLIVIDALEGGNSIDMASQQAHKVFGLQIPDSDDAIEGAGGDEAALEELGRQASMDLVRM